MPSTCPESGSRRIISISNITIPCSGRGMAIPKLSETICGAGMENNRDQFSRVSPETRDTFQRRSPAGAEHGGPRAPGDRRRRRAPPGGGGPPRRQVHVSAVAADHPARFELLSRSEEHTSELQSLRHLVCRL